MRFRGTRVTVVVGIAVAVLVVFSGLASSAVRSVVAKECSSCPAGYKWGPATKDIAKGDKVKWTNNSGVSHNIKSRGSNWSYFKSLPNGGSVTREFNKTGTFRYRCTIHSGISDGKCVGMCGKITV